MFKLTCEMKKAQWYLNYIKSLKKERLEGNKSKC